MKIIRMLYVLTAEAFYAWAEREIDKTHPDVPKIVMRRRELRDEARRLFA